MTEFAARLQAALSDRYRIERELGRGGMATVYLVHDIRHDRLVALKVFHPDLGAAQGERFLREIRVAAKLSHPHILTVHDSGDDAGMLWYTMPVVDGESLRQRILREPQLPVEEAVRLARTVAEALDFAHAHGVIHRDIKPENILLFGNEPMVADFGIALAIDAIGPDRLTQTGFSLGTPAYMSPEQACADPNLDGRTDIYSLGCVLYELLAGVVPFTGPTPHAVVARRLAEPPPPLRTLRDLPEALEQAIYKALARSPADRFATGRDFARAITEVMASAPGTMAPRSAAPATPARRRASPKMLAGAAALVLALGLVWAVARRSATAVPTAQTQLAVLPFSVPSAGTFAYLAEGMVDLLSRNLSAGEALVTVDPARVMSAVRRGEPRGIQDPGRGHDIARRLGAGQYVLGSVHAVGGHLRIQAQLYRSDSAGSRTIAQAAVEGDSTSLFELVDELSAQLLVHRSGGQGARLAQTAALTTNSLTALKAYLDAERNLRSARFDSAVAGFQRAVVLDSGFALAYYRLAAAAMWTGRMGLLAPATTRALALGERLSDRDRRLLSAFAALVQGEPDVAERGYREILEAYPDDLEARFQLANLLYTYNAPRGRPPAEAVEQYGDVLSMDPEFLCPI